MVRGIESDNQYIHSNFVMFEIFFINELIKHYRRNVGTFLYYRNGTHECSSLWASSRTEISYRPNLNYLSISNKYYIGLP